MTCVDGGTTEHLRHDVCGWGDHGTSTDDVCASACVYTPVLKFL